MNVREDRVFGRPETWPRAALLSGPSQAMDLCSISVGSAQVVYGLQGTIVHPRMVFLHGWGASHRVWSRSFTAFAPHYRCIAPDLAGFGLSEKPRRDYSLDGYVDWLDRFLDSLKIDKATVVAHSMGGTIALKYALKHPGRLERLVVINPVVRGRDAFFASTRWSMKPVIRTLIFLGARLHWVRRCVAADFSYVRDLEEELINDLARGGYAAMMDSYDSMARTDLVEPLESLKVDTLLVHSDRDEVVNPRQADLVPAKVVERALIPECGHMPMLERPETFNRTVASWLQGREQPVHAHRTR